MRRLLLLVVALVGLIWWIYRSLVQGRRPDRSVERGSRDLPASGTMVRDRVCNTFLPRERALTTRLGSEEFFFCSEGCRDSFLASRRQ
jgi:YHS domain-containing protein